MNIFTGMGQARKRPGNQDASVGTMVCNFSMRSAAGSKTSKLINTTRTGLIVPRSARQAEFIDGIFTKAT